MRHSRRNLLLSSAALVLASCGGSDPEEPKAETVSEEEAQSDAAILAALLDMEHSAIVAYGLIETRLAGRERAAARSFRVHERAHAAALRRAIVQLGGAPQEAQPAATYEATFPTLGGKRDALALALDLERTAVAAYADALPQLVTDEVRVTAASILVTEAEHSAVLLGALGEPQVPDPFVTGPPPEIE